MSSRIKISDPILTERANLAHWRHERREEKEGLEEEAREEEKLMLMWSLTVHCLIINDVSVR